MLVLNKKSKIFLYIIIFVLLVLGGFAVEHFEKDAFVMETVATEDYIPYESDTKEVADGKININSADTEQLVKLKGIGEKTYKPDSSCASRMRVYRLEAKEVSGKANRGK